MVPLLFHPGIFRAPRFEVYCSKLGSLTMIFQVYSSKLAILTIIRFSCLIPILEQNLFSLSKSVNDANYKFSKLSSTSMTV